jgi:hypothetical protein
MQKLTLSDVAKIFSLSGPQMPPIIYTERILSMLILLNTVGDLVNLT